MAAPRPAGKRFSCLLAAAWCCVAAPVAAAPSSIEAHLIQPSAGGEAVAVHVDGDLTETIWQSVPVTDDFVQRDPSEGAAPSFRTEVRVVYDRSNLFVAIRAFDAEPAKLVGILTRRDDDSPSDWLRIMI